MVELVGIDFACNDGDNGLFAHSVHAIQLYVGGDPFFELEPRADRAPTLRRYDDGSIMLSGKRWPTRGWNEWVGNWCWDRFFFTIDDAAAFLIWLHRRRLFSLSCGDERLFTAWRGKDLAAFRPFLIDNLREAAR